MEQLLTVVEIFGPTIQGEGALIGKPTVFVRLGACDYRCAWCDSMYAVDPKYKDTWLHMSPASVMTQIRALSGGIPLLVTLSGGNPAIQNLSLLLDLGHAEGYTFCMETQGSISRSWFRKLDQLTLSPKPPSSGMSTDWERLQSCVDRGAPTVFKVVVFDENDYQFAREVGRRFPGRPIYLQVGNTKPTGEANNDELLARLDWLANRVIANGWYNATVLPQLHVLLWGNKRGV